MISLQQMADELGLRKDTENNERADFFCPVHDNNSADLSVYKSNHSEGPGFACHHEGGEKAISLLMHCKGWSNKDKALSWMQERWPDEFNADEEEIDRTREAKKVLKKASSLAHDTLKKQKKELYEEIKENRDFTDETMEKAKIGYLSYDDIDLLKKRFDAQALKDSGLFREDSDSGDLFSHLARRITFPYLRGQQVLFMAGRKVPGSDKDAKYKKAVKTDYNQHILYQFEESDKDSVVIAEGFTDSISALQASYNVVSPATVKFRDKDIEKVVDKVSDYDTVYIANDADERGQEGAEDTAKALVEEEIDPKMVDLPEGQDLDDWTSEKGYEVENLLEDAQHFLDIEVEEAEDASKRQQTQKSKEVLELVSSWDEIDVEWILDDLPVRKGKLEDKFEEIQVEEEKHEPNEPDEPNELDRTKDIESEGGLLNQLQEEESRESIRMSGITEEGTKISTTFMKLKGMTKPIVLAETENGRELLEVNHKLGEYEEETLEEMTNDQKEKNDYHYVEIDEKELILEPRPLKIEDDMKTPDSGLLNYFNGEKEISENLFTKIKDYVQDHWYHYNDEWYDVLAAWIIHTYLLQDLPVTPYIFLTGVKDTGKTQAQRVLNQLAYHSVRNEQITPASMERQVSYSHSTVHLDEMDSLSEEEVTRITRTVNSGYNHGATRTLVNTNVQDIERQNQTLHTYSAKTIAANGLHKYSDTVKSRGFIIDSTPKPGDVEIEDIRRPSEGKKAFLSDLRNQLFWLSISKREDLLQRIEEARSTLDIENRQEDKLSIVFGIIQYFKDEEYAADTCDFLLDQSMMKGKDLNPNDKAFLTVVADYTNSDGLEMKLSHMAEEINDRANNDEDSSFRVRSRTVGKKLRKYGLVQDGDEHKPRREDGYYAKIPQEIILKQFRSHGFDELASTIQGSSSLKEINSVRSSSSGSPGSSGSSKSRDFPSDSEIKEKVESLVDEKGEAVKIGRVKDELEEEYQPEGENRERFERQFSEDNRDSGVYGMLSEAILFEPRDGYVKTM